MFDVKLYVRDYETPLINYESYIAHKQILLIVPPILLVIGTLGNVFSFLILLKNVKKASTYSYLSVLALMDILVLYIGLCRLWIGQFMIDVENMSNLLCKVVVFMGYFCSDTSVWLIVAVTIERSIVVMFPLKASRLCNARNARICIALIVVIFTVINSHFLFSVHLQQFSYNNTVISKCQAVPFFSHLTDDIWPWVDAAIYSFVPFLFIIILNTFIIKNVISAKKTRTFLRQHSARSPNDNAQRIQGEMSRKLTIMLLAVSFTFLVTTIPMNIALIYKSFSEKSSRVDDATLAKRLLLDTIAEMLMYTNHSINFFLYCATGRKFRNQFKALLCYCCCVEAMKRKLSQTSKRSNTKESKVNLKSDSGQDACRQDGVPL